MTGSGRADKASVGRMVTRILGLDSMPKPADAADALAIAICHGWRGGGIGSGINMAAQTQTHQGSRPAGSPWRVVDSGAACLDGGGGALAARCAAVRGAFVGLCAASCWLACIR